MPGGRDAGALCRPKGPVQNISLASVARYHHPHMSGDKISAERWVGFEVKSGTVIIVQFLVPIDGPIDVELDATWKLQTGPRHAAYHVMYERIRGHLHEREIDRVAVMGSAVSGFPAKQVDLDAAELRGVVIAASAAVVPRVVTPTKGSLSRKSSRGKVDYYTEDDAYWKAMIKGGTLRKGSREVAYVVASQARLRSEGAS